MKRGSCDNTLLLIVNDELSVVSGQWTVVSVFGYLVIWSFGYLVIRTGSPERPS